MSPTDEPDQPGARLPGSRSHWESGSKWPGLVMVAAIVAVLLLIWLIAKATHSDKPCTTLATQTVDGKPTLVIITPSTQPNLSNCD